MTAEFKDPWESPPDWGDGGPVELRSAGGEVVRGEMLIDASPTADDEVPCPVITLPDGTKVSIWDYEAWRPVE